MKSTMLVVVLAAVTGCASVPVPADKYARARETVAQADAMPAAGSDPRAAQHLELAKGQLQQAKRLMVDGDNRAAEWVLLRAQADAETALSLAQARAAQVDAQATIEKIQRERQAVRQEGRGS
jgi:hypothetical protein